jgi:hypothetical protein
MPIILPGGHHLYDETNFRELLYPAGRMLGMKPRLAHPLYAAYGSIPGTRRFEEAMPPKIPRGDWPAMIEEMDAKWMWATDRIRWKSRDQNGTNFCWANGPCTAGEIQAAKQNIPYIEWSAASLACKINGYVNQGGWGSEAIKYLLETGACSVDLWPNTAINRKYDTAASQADRAHHKVLEWIDVPSDDFDALATCLLLGYACAVGYNWWRHEVCACRLVKTGSNSYGVEIRNSWGDWGSANRHGVMGFSVLSESKGTPDDCQAVRQVVMTNQAPVTGALAQAL